VKPVALQLRVMNIICETTEERGSTIFIPTATVGVNWPAAAPAGEAAPASIGFPLAGEA